MFIMEGLVLKASVVMASFTVVEFITVTTLMHVPRVRLVLLLDRYLTAREINQHK